MTQTSGEEPTKRRLHETIEALFRELLTGLPDGSASLKRSAQPQSVMVELLPSRPGAASLTVIVPANDVEEVTLIAGHGSFFEIPERGGRYTGLPLIQELKSICEAVIAGRLEEWVVLDGDEVLKGTGVVQLDRPVTVRWRQLSFRPFRKKHKQHYRYGPWV